MHKVLERRRQMIDFEQKNLEAINTAFQAMTSSSELGQIIQFLQSSFTYKSAQALANGLLKTTRIFGLNCCLNVRCGFKDEYFGCETDSIEAKVLKHFRDGDRVLDFGARTLVNGKNISLLVKNMPLNKPDMYGRIKDHLIVLVSGSEACVKSLEVEDQLEEQRRSGIQSVVLKSHEELKAIRALICEQEVASQRVIVQLSDRIDSLMYSLGLEEQQEKAITEAFDSGINEIRNLAEVTARVESSFNRFVSDLDNLVE